MREVLARAQEILANAGVEHAREDAERLLAETLHTNRAGLMLRAEERLASDAFNQFALFIGRRAAREPLQHLLGRWPFLDLELKVDGRALVPRPETEDLVVAARRRLPAGHPAVAADVGAGCGCIALALAATHSQARIFAIDSDPAALSLAAENAAAFPFGERVDLLLGDLLSPLGEQDKLDLIVANLPYVRPDEFETLPPEVRLFDPQQALVAPDDGLGLIRRLIAGAPAYLRLGGWIALEMSPPQTKVVAADMAAANWKSVATLNDRFGRARIVQAQRV